MNSVLPCSQQLSERYPTMFTICQGSCFCASTGEGFGKAKQKVLYCFGEVGIGLAAMTENTSLAAPGALTQCPLNPKLPMGSENRYPYVIGPSDQLSLNKFFDPIIPSTYKNLNNPKCI